MKAIMVRQAGGPDQLSWVEAANPRPGPGEVVVQVAATAVNHADLRQRRGLYPVPPGASAILGLECAGTVAEVGPGVDGVAVGDRVCALLDGGGYAERVAVPQGQLLPIPDELDFPEAASLPEAACTVWLNLVMLGELTAGQTVLVHGGTSGVGTLALQIIRELGAQAVATAGSARKTDWCRDAGAIAVDYHREDFVTAVRDATEGRGADLVLDCVGAPYLARNLDALADGGRLLIIGLLGGRTTEIDLNTLLRRRLTLTAGTLRARSAPEKARVVGQVREHLWPLLGTGRVRPVVDRVLPVLEAAEAHRAMEAGGHIGKIVLTIPAV